MTFKSTTLTFPCCTDLLESVRCLKRFVEMFSDRENDKIWREWVCSDVCSSTPSLLAAYLIVVVCRAAEVEWRSGKVRI